MRPSEKIKILPALIALAFMLPCTAQAQDKCLNHKGRVTACEQADEVNPPRVVSISPDGHWLFLFRHYGSHAEENYLYHSEDGVRFVPAKKESDKKVLEERRQSAKWSNISRFETAESFDEQAWKFLLNTEGIPEKDAGDLIYPAEFVEWSADGSRLLFSITNRIGLKAKDSMYDGRGANPRNDRSKPGVQDWRAYYNLRTDGFELTDELRARNKEARKHWSEGNDSANSGPPNEHGTNESINPPNEEIQTFIQAFVRDMASNDTTLQMRYYNNPCRYYDQGHASLPTIQKDIERDITAWKKRAYSLRTQPVISQTEASQYTATFEMAYTLEDPNPKSSGILAMSLSLKQDNGTFLITGIQKRVISAHKG
jgi:hypothetical protein